jgi:hypothetical protein
MEVEGGIERSLSSSDDHREAGRAAGRQHRADEGIPEPDRAVVPAADYDSAAVVAGWR